MSTQDECDYYIKIFKDQKIATSNGHRLGKCMELMDPIVRNSAGKTTKYLQIQMVHLLRCEGMEPSCRGYHGYPEDICISINEQVAHGVPNNDYIIQKGDIVKLDVVANRKGIHVDTCRTIEVVKKGQNSTAYGELHRQLNEVAREAVLTAGSLLAQDVKMSLINDVLRTVIVNKHGFSFVQDLYGHGIGATIHEAPYIGPGIADKADTAPFGEHIIQLGDMYALEVFVTDWDNCSIIVDKADGWTLMPTRGGTRSVHYEDTFFVGTNGSINLTARGK